MGKTSRDLRCRTGISDATLQYPCPEHHFPLNPQLTISSVFQLLLKGLCGRRNRPDIRNQKAVQLIQSHLEYLQCPSRLCAMAVSSLDIQPSCVNFHTKAKHQFPFCHYFKVFLPESYKVVGSYRVLACVCIDERHIWHSPPD